MKRYALLLIAALVAAVLAAPQPSVAQSALLQAGPWVQGHFVMYGAGGFSQAVGQDAGGALGGAPGTNPAEIGIAARGTGLPPYAAQGSGPYGTNSCLYDGPTTSAAGYHYFCFSANAQGGELIAIGNGGGASPLPLQFIINGVTITGVTCSGSPTSSFASISGIVTHC